MIFCHQFSVFSDDVLCLNVMGKFLEYIWILDGKISGGFAGRKFKYDGALDLRKCEMVQKILQEMNL